MKKKLVVALLMCSMLSLTACGKTIQIVDTQEVEADEYEDSDDDKDNEDEENDEDKKESKKEKEKDSDDDDEEDDDVKSDKDSDDDEDEVKSDDEDKENEDKDEETKKDVDEDEKDDEDSDKKDTSSVDVDLISSDWHDNEVLLDGEPLVLTETTLQDLVNLGWTIEEEAASEEMGPMYYTMTSVYFEKGSDEIAVQAYNPSETDTVSLLECNICSIKADDFLMENPETLVFANGVAIGMEEDDITKVLGEPDDIYYGEYSTSYTYAEAVYKKLEIRVSVETGLISEIEQDCLEDYR